uniref:Uncharacterized protein n=1 Tax=Ditylenchus dipsaci TaxID=166011 RepID=A0A915DGH3_9BILA
MELYLFRPKQHYRLYGCANITVEDVPLEKRQHITEGVIIIALTATYYADNLAANYINNLHLIWDGGFSIAIPTLYIVFSLLFIAKFKKLKGDIKISRLQKLMLLQVFIISVLNLSTVSLYVAMMFIVPNEFIIHFAHFSWFHIHGIPPIIFCCLIPLLEQTLKGCVLKFSTNF